MEAKIVSTALILGLVFGSLMLCSLLFFYIKHKTFGLVGAVLTVFGAMLLGLSIWKTVEISVTPKGEIEAKLEALEKRVEDVREIANSTTAKVKEIDTAQNLVIREITNVRSSVIPEGEIDAKFKALEKRFEDVREIADFTSTKVEEIDKAQNLVIREIKNVRSSVTPEGEIDAKFKALEKRVEDVREIVDSTTAKIEEIDKAQNLVIREITNVQSSMYKIEDHIKYLEVSGGPAAEPSKDLSIRD